ncbi:hypothetical protein C8A00DRAFT_39178 [Chaetomidium leptoderma]|uniref:HMG box domain-containing protein n=1 Tax=Chaetomidium leptoderma TaxID=669021 RepID=A0AAN7A1W9_9PEZI|nr:hypothetical protein C8A00DRAFT_39178 [Chaetomidium leptoderma]
MSHCLWAVFGELGITQYLDGFLEQGFDTWETILDITESDLDVLGVKLGHRRKLQRRIASSRGIAAEASLMSPAQSPADEPKHEDVIKTEAQATDGRDTAGVIVTKRKYRRHPKSDDNAPERPPSAYVLFSNKMREELKGRNLSFTEIAKLVGENWQNLTAAEKEPFESQAQAIKDKYLSDLTEYKKAPEYKKYMTYLQEFKAKHASPSQDKDASKRVRLSESGGQGRSSPGATPTRTSRSGSSTESGRGSEPSTSRSRVDSMVSMSETQYTDSSVSSVLTPSPDEPVLSPAVSNPERRFSDRSPSFTSDLMDQSLLPGPRHSSQGDDPSRDPLSMHRHLPSLSDVFDGQGLPGGMRTSNEPNGYRFPGPHMIRSPGPPLGHPNGDTRTAPHTNGNGLPYGANPSSHPTFGQPRPPVDGPLPIHALLASKPEPPFHTNQRPHLQSGNPYHVDQNHGLVHHTPNGAVGLPMINGYHHHQPPLHGHHINRAPGQQQQQQQQQQQHLQQQQQQQQPAGPPSSSGLPQQRKQNANLDGMSALLKAGEIVDRRAQ